MKAKIMRGEMYYADLNPIVGSEQGGVRPVLILQNNIGNKHSPTVVVAPIATHREKHILPTHVELVSKRLAIICSAECLLLKFLETDRISKITVKNI